MNEIIKVYQQKIGPMKFIGKKYTDYSHWGEWFENGWFDTLEEAMGGIEAILKIWEDGGGYVGLAICKGSELTAYWIGMFTPIDTVVPEGFESIAFENVKLGICWVYGKEGEVHDVSQCAQEIISHGMKIITDQEGRTISFENCLCPRYTTPDEKGNVILDYCYLVK